MRLNCNIIDDNDRWGKWSSQNNIISGRDFLVHESMSSPQLEALSAFPPQDFQCCWERKAGRPSTHKPSPSTSSGFLTQRVWRRAFSWSSPCQPACRCVLRSQDTMLMRVRLCVSDPFFLQTSDRRVLATKQTHLPVNVYPIKIMVRQYLDALLGKGITRNGVGA